MKTLDDWLASSSSSSGSASDREGSGAGSEGRGARRPLPQASPLTASRSPASVSVGGFPGSASAAGSVVSSTAARTPTAAFSPTSHSSRMDETRAKMEKLLGQESLQRAQSSASVSVAGSVHSPIVQQHGAMNVPFGLTPVAGNDAAAHQFTVATGAAVADSVPAPSPGLLKHEQQPQQQGGHASADARFEPVEVMVVDRGTQTVSTVGVQTDPEPPFPPSFPGHSNSTPCGYPPPFYFPAGLDYTARAVPGRFGIDGRPYRQHFRELEQRQSRDAGELRAQLEQIQNSIDMLIARYNLPPPPFL